MSRRAGPLRRSPAEPLAEKEIMNWVCPSCGANDNEEASIRCSCGFILEENIRSKVKWVETEPPMAPPLAPSMPFRKRPLKYKIGHFIYVSSIVGLGIFAVMMLTTKWLPSKRTVAMILSVATLVNTYSTLLTEDIGIKGVGAVRKADSPGWFWSQFWFQVSIGIMFALVAIFVR